MLRDYVSEHIYNMSKGIFMVLWTILYKKWHIELILAPLNYLRHNLPLSILIRKSHAKSTGM